MTQTPPRWNLTNIYESVDDPRLAADFEWIQAQTAALEARFQTELQPLSQDSAQPETPSS